MTVTVSGSLVQILDAVAFLEGVAPHQLLNDVVRSWLAEAAQDPGVRSAQATLRQSRAPLSQCQGEDLEDVDIADDRSEAPPGAAGSSAPFRAPGSDGAGNDRQERTR